MTGGILMYSITIDQERTINSRQAANFVYNIQALQSDVWLTKCNRRVNAKSILGVLSINIQKGDKIELSFSNNDENDIKTVINEFKSEQRR